MTTRVVGVDVGKEKLDVNLNGQKRVREWANDEAGRAELGRWVVEQEAELVVVEASGGYERALVSELVAREQAVALVNPTRVRAFARAEGVLAKTDKIGAGDCPLRGQNETRSPGQTKQQPGRTERKGHAAAPIGGDAHR